MKPRNFFSKLTDETTHFIYLRELRLQLIILSLIGNLSFIRKTVYFVVLSFLKVQLLFFVKKCRIFTFSMESVLLDAKIERVRYVLLFSLIGFFAPGVAYYFKKRFYLVEKTASFSPNISSAMEKGTEDH